MGDGVIFGMVLLYLSVKVQGPKADVLERIGTRLCVACFTALCCLWVAYGHASASFEATGSVYYLSWIDWLRYTAFAICL